MTRINKNENTSYDRSSRSLKITSVKKDDTWQQSEERAADMIGGKTTIASGALQIDKGDFKSNEYRGECKFTDQASMSLKVEWLRKISGEAMSNGKTPLMFLTFGQMPVSKDWVMMEKAHFEEKFESHEPLILEIKELRKEVWALKNRIKSQEK